MPPQLLRRLAVPAVPLLAAAGLAGPAAANMPPLAPLWLEPDSSDVVSAFDPHFNVYAFVDPDSGDVHLSSDFEVWDDSLGVRVWAAIETAVLVHIHLGDGVIEGPLAGETRLDFDRPYRVRARFRDDSGEPDDHSSWSVWIPFRTAAQFQPFPMLVEDLPPAMPEWKKENGGNVELPYAGGSPAFLRLLGGGEPLFRIYGTASGLAFDDHPPLGAHAPLKLAFGAGGTAVAPLSATRLEFQDEDGTARAFYLPPVAIPAGDTLFYWVDATGNTYHGASADTVPDFSSLAQGVFVPWEADDPALLVERVAMNLHLPVNVAFVPDPGPDSLAPWFYVTELYGKVKVVSRDLSIRTFADSLLNFDPTGPFPGSGEMGVTGIAVDPGSGDVFVSGAYDSLGSKYNRVLRLHAASDGLTATGRTTVLEGIPSFASHQIQSVTIGPDGKLYVQVGDGFGGGAVAQDPDDLRGKVLRMNLDGTPPGDNPFGPASLVFAIGVRNPFGGTWRQEDGRLYCTDNGTNEGDRVLKMTAGSEYGYCCDWARGAIHVFPFRVGPTALDFDDVGILGASHRGNLFVAWSGPTYALGQVQNGKRIWELAVDDTGGVVSDAEFLHYTGAQRGTVVGLAVGPDGLYFTDLYGEEGFDGQGLTRANIYRVRRRDQTGLPDEPGRPFTGRLIGAPYPNPSSAAFAVRVRLDRASELEAIVLDVRGSNVRALFRGSLGPGEHELRWDGRDDRGRRVGAGVYWIHLREAGSPPESARVILLR